MSEFASNCCGNMAGRVQTGTITAEDVRFLKTYKEFKRLAFQVSFSITGDRQASEDICQDVFLKLWQQKGLLKEIKDPAAFINILSRNKSIDYVRKLKHDRMMINHCAQSKSICFDLNDVLDKKETEQLLQLAITTLSPHRRRVFELGWLEGYTREEIAQRLQVSPHTIKNLMQQARHDIQIFFTRHTGMKGSSLLRMMKHIWNKGNETKVA